MSKQNKRRRVEGQGVENTVSSVMSSAAPNNQLLSDERYYSFVDKMAYDAHYNPNWRAYGWRRYYNKAFWGEMTNEFNRRVHSAGLPPITSVDLPTFMEDRRQQYYQKRYSNNFSGDIGQAFKPCDNCLHIPFFPRAVLQTSNSGYGHANGSVSYGSRGSGSGYQSRAAPDPYAIVTFDLYVEGRISEEVYACSSSIPDHQRDQWASLDHARLVKLLVAWSNTCRTR